MQKNGPQSLTAQAAIISHTFGVQVVSLVTVRVLPKAQRASQGRESGPVPFDADNPKMVSEEVRVCGKASTIWLRILK